MATKPSTLPRWAETSGGTQSPNIDEPLSGDKDLGWFVDQRPPAEWLNWWQNLVYRWTAWLDDLTNQALTWVARQTFSDGILINAPSTSNRPGADATGNGTAPALKGTAANNASSAGVEGVGVGSAPGARLSASATGKAAVLTSTAAAALDVSSTGSNAISASTTGASGTALLDSSGGSGPALQVVGNASQPAATFNAGAGQPGATFANGTSATGGARQNAAKLTNGDLDLTNVALPTSTTSIVNTLTSSGITKSWASIQVTNANPFVPSVDAGLNVASVSRQGANTLRVTFAGAMANANYAVNASYLGAILGVMLPVATGGGDGRTTGYVDLTAYDWAGAAVSLDSRAGLGGSGTLKIILSVHGNQ